MRKLIYSIFGVVALLSTSCSKDKTEGTDNKKPAGPVEVEFKAEGIDAMTKAVDTSWESGDKVGVFQFNVNDEIVANNVCYQADGEGQAVALKVTNADDAIKFPEGGEVADFWAYYPYQENYDFENPTFSIADQDGTTTAKADYMEAVKLRSQKAGEQKFTFSHKLSKVVINVEHGSALANLDDLAVTIDGVATEVNLKGFTAANDADNTITAVLSENNSVATAIVLPVATDAMVKLVAGGNEYELELNGTFVSGKQYSYDVCIGNPDVPVVLTSTSIDAWVSGGEASVGQVMVNNNGVYEIYSAAGLQAFAALVNGGETDIDGKLMADIDLSEVCGAAKGSWKEIGTYSPKKPYAGVFDGNGHTVENLFMTGMSHSCSGLFGYTSGALIKNVTVKNASVVSDSSHVGMLIGYARETTVLGCSVLGGDVEGTKLVGGLIGSLESGTGIVASCFSTATATAPADAAGLIGYSDSSVLYCFSSTTVVGRSTGVNTDNETKSESEMKEEAFVTLLNEGVDKYNKSFYEDKTLYWKSGNGDYPAIDMESTPDTTPDVDETADIELVDGVYQIKTAVGLQKFSALVAEGALSADAELMADVDLIDICNESVGNWNEIGVYKTKPYSGVFEGNGHTIENLYMSGISHSCAGLFGFTKGATIKNIVLKNASVATTSTHAGLLVGYASGATVVGCSVIGGSVEGTKQIGGLVGSNEGSSTVVSCFSTATATATSDAEYAGGLIGYNTGGSNVLYSYASNGIIGKSYGPGEELANEAKTEAEMQEELFVKILNNGAYDYNESNSADLKAWVYNAGGYPTIDVDAAPEYKDLGTPEDPDINLKGGVYEIKTVAGLQKFAEMVNGGSPSIDGKLVNDLDLSSVCGEGVGSWTPIGFYKPSKNPYRGSFDGAGHTIKNLYIDHTGGVSCYGLFSYAVGATIKNIILENPIVKSTGGYLGALVGWANETTYVVGCAAVGGSVTAAGKNVGGLIGSLEVKSVVASCFSSAVVTGGSAFGSVVGYDSGIIDACYGISDESECITGVKTIEEMQEEAFVELLNASEYNKSTWVYSAGGYPTIE